MIKGKNVLFVTLLATLAAGSCALSAQESVYARFREQNARMAALQPSWMGPLIQSDPRLAQAVRISVSNAYAPGAQIISYGNNHGLSVVAARRFQFDVVPPSYFRNHSATLKDGFGNAAVLVKYRIASGNAEGGNYALTAIVSHGFGPRAYQNDLLTAYYDPKLASGVGFGRFNVQSTLGGLLPTGKIATQGRAIEWNLTAQVHPTQVLWFDVENNASFFVGGEFDGKTQNFLTPAAFYAVRRREWAPTHPIFVFDSGMQIATSSFHIYNHNLIAEMRMLF